MANIISNEQLEEYLTYVDQVLEANGHKLGRRHPFRNRTLHTRRVMRWAERLMADRDDVDRDVLLVACAFHDIGYTLDENVIHEKRSAEIFEQYAREQDFDAGFTAKVLDCISIHSEKERLREPETLTIEQILLMEADLLDEEGALAICWDSMAVAYEGLYSYTDAYERSRKGLSKMDVQPMVTDKAKLFWSQKQEFLYQYVQTLGEDLDEWRR